MPCHANWPVAAESTGTITELPSQGWAAAHTTQAQITLSKPPNGCSCTLTVSLQPHQAGGSLHLASNARVVELHVVRAGAAAAEYISTVRTELQDGWHQALIQLETLPVWDALQLKLLSLQGSRDKCRIAALWTDGGDCGLIGSTQPAAGGESITSTTHLQQESMLDSSSSSSRRILPQPQQQLSQLDEVRLLVSRVQQQQEAGAASVTDAASAMPESLQLLFSKAVQPSAGSSVQALSAAVAQGMLLKARTEAAGSPSRPVHTQQQPQAQQQQAIENQVCQNGSQPPHAGKHYLQPVLAAMQRIESKMDRLLTEMNSITSKLHQIDSRLAAVEQCTVPASHCGTDDC